MGKYRAEKKKKLLEGWVLQTGFTEGVVGWNEDGCTLFLLLGLYFLLHYFVHFPLEVDCRRKVEIVVFSLSLPFPVYFFLSDKFKINIQVGKRWQLKIPNIFLKNRTYQNRGLHFMFATVARFHNMNVLSNIKHFSYKSLNVTDISFSVLLSLQCINVCWILYANRILLHTTFHCEFPQYGNYRNSLSHLF